MSFLFDLTRAVQKLHLFLPPGVAFFLLSFFHGSCYSVAFPVIFFTIFYSLCALVHFNG